MSETGFDNPGVLAHSRNARTTRTELIVADMCAVKSD
jgi:hypothetical protein